MAVRIASSTNTIKEAVGELHAQLTMERPTLIVYFASSQYDTQALAQAMKKEFPSSGLMGCSTSGEIISGHVLDNSVVAMAFDEETVEDFNLQVVKDLSSKTNVREAFKHFEQHFGMPTGEMDMTKAVGLILIDGLSGAEERVMDAIGDATDLTFIGGSAGDDLKFKQTFVIAEDEVLSGAAVLAIVKFRHGFDIIKTQSFELFGKKLCATAVDEAKRTVLAFDNQPASKAYAQAIGTEAGDIANHFMENPLGLMVDAEPYVRSPQQANNGHMVFYCNIKEGMELQVLKSFHIVEDTRVSVQRKLEELGNISGLINFHCILRTLDLKNKKQADAYGRVFADIPTIGFSTYGEQYVGHINQTSTMLVIK